ncbi:winged helix DNA-binding domain-containing protein [Cryptosporangium sp. NPDC048952]|uniref:winged helix DNA-binding domain-containing protein n=1 Tax=Cryptosporangium sp. NPDC048952 TaxID=3363961 RepID=UPI00371F7568
MISAQVSAARAASQLLAVERAASAAEVVERLGALQAQDLSATALAVRARSSGLVASELGLESSAYVRTWLMRGTLHLVAAEDAGWMLSLLGPLNRARGARRRAQLGLDDALCARAVAALPEVLADGPLDRTEVVTRLASLGVPIGPGQAAPHLLAYAASLGVLALGPEIARGQATYRLLDPATPSSADAVTELARRYLVGHQPAGWADFAAWSGLGLRQARAAFAALDEPTLAPRGSAEPTVRLVGHFDPYLLGYADKSASVPAEHVSRVRTGGGFVTPTVLVDGRATATWRRAGSALTVEPFHPLPGAVLAAVEHEVSDISRFLDSPLTLTI